MKKLFTFVLCGFTFVGCKRNFNSDVQRLPNDSFYDRESTAAWYSWILDSIQRRGIKLSPAQPQNLKLVWPLSDKKTSVLNRFGTPIIFSAMQNVAYFHDSLDAMLSSASMDDSVRFPTGGLAAIYNFASTAVEGPAPNPYQNFLVVFEPKSQLIVTLMHLKVEPALLAQMKQSGGFVEVKASQLAGKLARNKDLPPQSSVSLRHVHMGVIDPLRKNLLNPLRFLPDYKDSVKPTVNDVYLLNFKSRKENVLSTGRFDIVVDAFDRDDYSPRNLELTHFEYQVKDQNGKVIQSLAKCSVDALTEPHATLVQMPAKSLLDLGNATSQVGIGGWTDTDIDNPNRSFRYALTHLVSAHERCGLKQDDDGYVKISDSVTSITVEGKVWDYRQNVTEFKRTFSR